MKYQIVGFDKEPVWAGEVVKFRHYLVLNNGKKIRYPSKCNDDCPGECRLFNGRDCPYRVPCENWQGDFRKMTRQESGRIWTECRALVKSVNLSKVVVSGPMEFGRAN